MSNRIKIELIAASLHETSHHVEIMSQGEVVEHRFRFYPSLRETEYFHPDIHVHYASALPIRRINGFWSSQRLLQLFKARHRVEPFDAMIIFNLKAPQVACANYAIRRLGLPVILEYEDDIFVDVVGERNGSLSRHERACRRLLDMVSGCVAVSPHLLSQLHPRIPTLLLRGFVGGDLVKARNERNIERKNLLLFCGTHIESNGVAQLIEAWRMADIAEWELHITGYGHLTAHLQEAAKGVPGVVFHGLVSREEVVRLMCSARICINPHVVSKNPGNVFAFKIIEYLAAGAHVVTTPMGPLEPEVEAGITYMRDNQPETIARTLREVVESRGWERTATRYVSDTYGTAGASPSLDGLLQQAVRHENRGYLRNEA
jgi:glycosyltransferase involved in cell wall biosynthesis